MRIYLLAIVFITAIQAPAQPGLPDNLLFNSFKQGAVSGGGNCASIALIKACIGTFGLGKVFHYTVSNAGNSIIVRLKNDSSVEVLFTEIAAATVANGFVEKINTPGAKQVRKYADTCFAVMVKVQQHYDDMDTYQEALQYLLNGYTASVSYRLLGVTFGEIDVSEISQHAHVIFYNAYHAVYSSYGYYDEPKSSTGIAMNRNFWRNHFGYKCSLYGCRPRRAFIIVE